MAPRRVEVPGRLVGDEQRRVGDDRTGDRDALLLAAGKLGRCMPLAAGQADFASASMARCRRPAATRDRPKGVPNSRPRWSAAADCSPGKRSRYGGCEESRAAPSSFPASTPRNPYRPPTAYHAADDDVHGRGLPGARRSHDRDETRRARSSGRRPSASTRASPSPYVFQTFSKVRVVRHALSSPLARPDAEHDGVSLDRPTRSRSGLHRCRRPSPARPPADRPAARKRSGPVVGGRRRPLAIASAAAANVPCAA